MRIPPQTFDLRRWACIIRTGNDNFLVYAHDVPFDGNVADVPTGRRQCPTSPRQAGCISRRLLQHRRGVK